MTQYPRIREARKAKKLSQKKLAEKAGISEIGVRNYEAGKRKPAIDTAVKLAKALGVSLDWLFADAPSPLKDPMEINLLDELTKSFNNLTELIYRTQNK